MKKRNLIIAGIIAIVVVAIALTGIFYPSAFNSGAEGTIAKVSKYHKEQMNENDVLMRSKILSDTALLQQTISSLVMFYAFSEKLSINLDETVVSLKSSDLSGNQKLIYGMKELEGYSNFIKNNNPTLDKTIATLLDLSQTKTTSTSTDIERNLVDFSNYVYQITVKDSILDSFIDNCDDYISDSEVFKEREKEIENLKNVRDNLLLDNAQLAYLVGNNDKLQSLYDKPIYNIDKLGMTNAGTIQNVVVANQGKLERIFSADQLNSVTLSNVAANAVLNSVDKDLGAYVLCDADKLNVLIRNKENIGNVILSSNELQNLFGSNYNQLNVILAQDGLRVIVFANNQLQAVNNQISLGEIIQAQTLSSGIVLCNKDALQNALSKQGDLNNVLKSSEMGNCATINSNGKLDRFLAVDALQFNLAAMGNKDVLNCALNKDQLSNLLNNNQSLSAFMATQQLNIIIYDKGTLSSYGNQSLGISANSTLENVLSNQIGYMYTNKLNSIIQNQAALSSWEIDFPIIRSSESLKNTIGSNIGSMQAVLSSFPSTLGLYY